MQKETLTPTLTTDPNPNPNPAASCSKAAEAKRNSAQDEAGLKAAAGLDGAKPCGKQGRCVRSARPKRRIG